MGILFKWPKIKAENTLQHFITNAHLLFILSLSSRTANSHAVHYADVYAAVTWSGKTPSLITIRIKGNVRNNPCYHKLNIRRKHNESHEYSQNNGTFNHSSGSIFSPYWCRKLIWQSRTLCHRLLHGKAVRKETEAHCHSPHARRAFSTHLRDLDGHTANKH